MASDEVKVHFELEQDDDDWPPVAVESIWATPVESGQYRLNNVPFFAEGVAYADVVDTMPRDGLVWFTAVARPSGNSTLHVFCFNAGKRQQFTDWLRAQGWTWEFAFDQDYIAVNVPAAGDVVGLGALLRALDEVEEFEYEFSCARHTV